MEEKYGRKKRLSREYKGNPGTSNSIRETHDEATRDQVHFLRFFKSMVDFDKFWATLGGIWIDVVQFSRMCKC